ncbi:NINE protein [Nodosilinea sp. LEGE 07088]|nr:NINE protein [Nodosilinea sp. LEGE 07088]
MAGSKEIPIRNITAVQFKPAGKTADWVPLVGYLQFSVLGGVEKQGGVFKAVDDENAVAFNPEQQPNFEEVKRYVDSIIDGEPISLSELKFTDPATVEIEQSIWNKPIEINKLKSNLLRTTDSSRELSQEPTVTRKPSRILVAITAIFLGFFGIHKFILGYHREGFILLGITLISMGTLSLFTWLVGLVEGIFYLLKSDRQFQTQYVENKRRWF